MNQVAIVIPELNADQVVTAENRYFHHAGQAWRFLKVLHDGMAHKARGYSTWKEYVETELHMSRQHSDRLLNYGEKMLLFEAEKAPMGALSERQTRDIPISEFPNIIDEVKEAVKAGADPVEAIQDAINERRVLPTPSEAQELATEHDVTISASDGQLKSSEIGPRVYPERIMPRWSAFQTISKQDYSPREYWRYVDAPMRPETLELAKSARSWLNEFIQEATNGHQGS